MEQVIDGKFPCGSCGKAFRWKPEIAGKKGKCSCGAAILVPATLTGSGKTPVKVSVPTTAMPKKAVPVTNVAGKNAPAIKIPLPRKPVQAVAPAPVKSEPIAPPPPPKPGTASNEEDQSAYDIADDDISRLDSLLPSAEAIAAAEREMPPIPAVEIEAAETAEPLEYHRGAKAGKASRSGLIHPDTGELHDPLRDYIVPTILLAAGLAGTAIAVVTKTGTGPLAAFAISIAFAIMLALTLFRTVVLIFAAVPIAAYCDVYVGLLRTAILKFAAIVLFSDVAILWIVNSLVAVGYVSQKDSGGFYMWFVSWFVMTLLYQLCVIYLFRIPPIDFKFAFLMALVARLANWFLAIIIVALFVSIAANRAQPVASPNIPARQQPMVNFSPNTPLTVHPGQTSPTPLDQMISAQIKRDPVHIIEGYAWCRTGLADDAAKKLISDMYNAGANKVYVGGFTMYAELPDNPEKRTACLAVAHDFRASFGQPNDSFAVSLNYQYAVVDMLGERLKHLHH